jgi:hypothetical protein
MDAESNRGLRARLRRPIPERTSEVLRELAEGEGERVTFREILLGLQHRAYGFALLLFALPCSLPMPPGIPTVCGIALVIIALNLIAARRRPWLPAVIAGKSVSRADLRRIAERATPYLERLERVCKPRFAIVTDSVGKLLIGIVILALGLIMILPIPFLGNMPPGLAASVIAIGMIERDGLVLLIGALAASVAIAVASVATWAAILGVVSFFAG